MAPLSVIVSGSSRHELDLLPSLKAAHLAADFGVSFNYYFELFAPLHSNRLTCSRLCRLFQSLLRAPCLSWPRVIQRRVTGAVKSSDGTLGAMRRQPISRIPRTHELHRHPQSHLTSRMSSTSPKEAQEALFSLDTPWPRQSLRLNPFLRCRRTASTHRDRQNAQDSRSSKSRHHFHADDNQQLRRIHQNPPQAGRTAEGVC